MRLIRFLLLLVALGAVYFAQSLFDFRSVAPLQNISLGARGTVGEYLPFLHRFNLLSPDELFSFALLLSALGSVGVGLLATRWYPTWQDLPKATVSPLDDVQGPWSLVRWLGSLLAITAVGMTLFTSFQIGGSGLDTPTIQAVWIVSLLLYLVGASLIDLAVRRKAGIQRPSNKRSSRSRVQPSSPVDPQSSSSRPESGWGQLLILLLLTGALFVWKLSEIPVRVDQVVAEIGLQSMAILRGETTALYSPGVTGLPLIAYVPTTIGIWLAGDPLLGLRLSGVATGLLTVLATWFLGCELFRRLPQYGPYETLIEDDGRWIALLAAAIVGFGHVIAHFSRLPVFLGPTAWGTLGLWALLRGLRTKDIVTLSASGMLIGLASILYAGGFFYLVVAPIWWIGVWLLSRHWLYSIDGVGSRGFILWLGGLALLLLPFASVWGRLPNAFEAYAQSDLLLTPMTAVRVQTLFFSRGVDALLLENLRLTFLTFNVFSNVGALFDFVGPFLNHWLAPLFFVGIGLLALNLDRLVGWLILSAVGTGIIWASISLSAPFWPRLLPLLPIVGLLVAFALDRIRVALMQSAGSWLEQTTVYLAMGLVIWGSVQGWLGYYTYAQNQDDLASYVGRAIQEMGPNQSTVVLVHHGEEITAPHEQITPLWELGGQTAFSTGSIDRENSIVKFFATSPTNPREVLDLAPDEWPETLPPLSRILLQPKDKELMAEIEARYGTGTVSIVRNLQSDPILYVYDLAGASAQ